MKSNRVLHVKSLYFNLPDNFDGTLGDAFTLITNRMIEAEAYNEVRELELLDPLNHLLRSDKTKCAIEWEIINVD